MSEFKYQLIVLQGKYLNASEKLYLYNAYEEYNIYLHKVEILERMIEVL